MDDFAGAIEAWNDFVLLAGTASATLIGLLFVALSLRIDIRTSRADSMLRTAAVQSLRNLLNVLLYALFFLMPNPTPSSIAWPLILTSLIFLATIARDGASRWAGLVNDRPTLFWHYLSPMACYIGAAIVGFGLLRSHTGWIYALVSIIALLLSIPTLNAWGMIFSGDEQAGT